MPDLPEAQNQFTDDTADAPYTKYGMRVTYRWKSGKISMPVAAPGDQYGAAPRTPPVICQTHAPAGSVLFEWSAERVGKKPVLPDPQVSEGTGLQLGEAVIVIEPPELEGDGTNNRWHVHGAYLYLEGGPPIWLKDGLPAGAYPFDKTSPTAYGIGPSDFSQQVNPLNTGGNLGRVG